MTGRKNRRHLTFNFFHGENNMKIRLSDHFSYKKLFAFIYPTVIMMVFTSIYGVVDGFFVSNFVGKTPFAAVNLIMPFVMVIGGMGFMVGTGGTALVSKAMGEGDGQKAKRYFSMMIYFTALLAVILSVVGIVFMRPVAHFLGATDEMLEHSVLYGRIVIGFTAAFMLQSVFQSFLVAAERPKMGLVCTVAAGVTNMALDALFIAVFKWGVAGAAVATGISQCVGGLIPLIYFIMPNKSRLHLVVTGLKARPILKACANGSSELMSNISSSLVGMLYNFQLLKFAGENGVSAYGVLMYTQFIFVAILLGYSIGTAPIVGFHYGASNTDELKNLLKKSTVIMGIGGVVLAVAALALSSTLAGIFVGYDRELYELTLHAFKIYSIHFVFAGFNIFASGFFTALNNGGVSAAISFLRTLVFQSSSVLILPALFGTDGIWWAVCVAEVAALIISGIFLFVNRRKYKYF